MMKDTTVSVAIVFILICHLATIIIGYKAKKTIVSISYLNATFGIGVFIFLLFDTLHIRQHPFEFRELFVLCIEACILIFALYSIIGFHTKTYVKVINHIGFWLHILAAIAMLIFITTFKLDRLY